MRNIQSVIAQVLAAFPQGGLPPEFADNLTALKAELNILSRTAAYFPPEATTELWSRLGAMCYRYLPPPTAAPWAAAISKVVLGN